MPRIYSRRGSARAWQSIHVGGSWPQKPTQSLRQGALEAKGALALIGLVRDESSGEIDEEGEAEEEGGGGYEASSTSKSWRASEGKGEAKARTSGEPILQRARCGQS